MRVPMKPMAQVRGASLGGNGSWNKVDKVP